MCGRAVGWPSKRPTLLLSHARNLPLQSLQASSSLVATQLRSLRCCSGPTTAALHKAIPLHPSPPQQHHCSKQPSPEAEALPLQLQPCHCYPSSGVLLAASNLASLVLSLQGLLQVFTRRGERGNSQCASPPPTLDVTGVKQSP